MDDLQTMAPSSGVQAYSALPAVMQEPDQAQQDTALALELSRLVVRQASSTYFLQINGHQWADLGIHDGSLVVIDLGRQAGVHDLLVAHRDGELKFRRQHQLEPQDTPWGVVTAVIHLY